MRRTIWTLPFPAPPTRLVIAGTGDASAPLALTSDASVRLLPNATLRLYEGAPHGMFITHRARVNADLLEFADAIGHNRRQTTGET